MGGEFVPGLIFAAFLVFAVIATVLASKASKERARALAEFAQANGFRFAMSLEPPGCSLGGSDRDIEMLRTIPAQPVEGFIAHFESMGKFNIGHSKRIGPILVRSTPHRTEYLFTYTYTTGSGKNQSTHVADYVIFQVPFLYCDLSISQQGFLANAAELLGIRDIQFESEEFNRRFYVRASDDRMAYDIINPQMMEMLLSTNPSFPIRAQNQTMLFELGSGELMNMYPVVSRFTDEFERLLPQFFKQDRAIAVPGMII